MFCPFTTWTALVEEGLRTRIDDDNVMLLMTDLTNGDKGMRELDNVLRSRCHHSGETPAEVLKLLTDQDIDDAFHSNVPGSIGEPGKVLASRVQYLPFH